MTNFCFGQNTPFVYVNYIISVYCIEIKIEKFKNYQFI